MQKNKQTKKNKGNLTSKDACCGEYLLIPTPSLWVLWEQWMCTSPSWKWILRGVKQYRLVLKRCRVWDCSLSIVPGMLLGRVHCSWFSSSAVGCMGKCSLGGSQCWWIQVGIVRGVQSQRVWIYLKINKCKSVHLPPTCSVILCLEVVPTGYGLGTSLLFRWVSSHVALRARRFKGKHWEHYSWGAVCWTESFHLSSPCRRQSDPGAGNWAQRLRVLGEDQKAAPAVNLSPAIFLTGACGHSSEVGPGSGFLLSL